MVSLSYQREIYSFLEDAGSILKNEVNIPNPVTRPIKLHYTVGRKVTITGNKEKILVDTLKFFKENFINDIYKLNIEAEELIFFACNEFIYLFAISEIPDACENLKDYMKSLGPMQIGTE